MENHTIFEDRAWIEDDSWKELAVFSNAATCHHDSTAMDVSSLADLAIIPYSRQSFDDRRGIDSRGLSNTRSRVDPGLRPHDTVWSEELADLCKGVVWIGYHDLRYGQFWIRPTSDARGSLRRLQSIQILVVIDQRDATRFRVLERTGSRNGRWNGIVFRLAKQLTMDAIR
jgi:hypothetical protein